MPIRFCHFFYNDFLHKTFLHRLHLCPKQSAIPFIPHISAARCHAGSAARKPNRRTNQTAKIPARKYRALLMRRYNALLAVGYSRAAALAALLTRRWSHDAASGTLFALRCPHGAAPVRTTGAFVPQLISRDSCFGAVSAIASMELSRLKRFHAACIFAP